MSCKIVALPMNVLCLWYVIPCIIRLSAYDAIEMLYELVFDNSLMFAHGLLGISKLSHKILY